MESRTNYVILKEHRLIIECFCGPIDLAHITELKKRVLADPAYNSAFNIIEDFRSSLIKQNKELLKKLVHWLKQNVSDSRYSAILTHNPHQVAAAELFAQYSHQLPMHIKVFSTVKASLDWAKAPQLDSMEVEELIDLLKS